MLHVGREGHVSRLISVRRTGQYTNKQEVVVEEKHHQMYSWGLGRERWYTAIEKWSS